MKKILFPAIFALFTSLIFAQPQNYEVGDVVNDFTVTDTEGVEHNLYEITASGKYVFLDFFFRNCTPCQNTSPYFNELYDKYGCNQGEVYMIALSPIDDNETVEEFEELYGGDFQHPPAAGRDGNGDEVVFQNFGVNLFPTYSIIGPDNKLLVSQIWSITSVESFENAFPEGLNPEPMPCSVMAVEDASKNGFSVYPTVSDGNLNVLLPKETGSVITVYDMNGKKVHSASYNSKNISLSLDLTSGVYVMNVTTNGKTNSKKIIIK